MGLVIGGDFPQPMSTAALSAIRMLRRGTTISTLSLSAGKAQLQHHNGEEAGGVASCFYALLI